MENVRQDMYNLYRSGVLAAVNFIERNRDFPIEKSIKMLREMYNEMGEDNERHAVPGGGEDKDS